MSSRIRERLVNTESRGVLFERLVYEMSLDPPLDQVVTVLRDEQHVYREVTEHMEDISTPSFNARSSRGDIINSPMTHTTTSIWNKPCKLDIQSTYENRMGSSPNYYWSAGGAIYYGTTSLTYRYGEIPTCFIDVPTFNVEPIQDAALSRAWSNVSLNSAYALVQIGEAEKTVFSFISLFKRFIKVLKSIKRLDARALKHEFTAKELADRYMELRYALRPLLYDFQGTVKALNYEVQEQAARLTFRGWKYYVDGCSEQSEAGNGYAGIGTNGPRTVIISKKADVVYDVRAGVLTQLETLSKLPVWGFTEPLQSAWELVPFSFIIDWFINVGDTIGAFAPIFGLKPLASWTVCTRTQTRTLNVIGTTAELPTNSDTWRCLTHVNNWTGGELGELIITKQRFPNPSRTLLPSLEIRLNAFKLADLVIIAKGLLRSR